MANCFRLCAQPSVALTLLTLALLQGCSGKHPGTPSDPALPGDPDDAGTSETVDPVDECPEDNPYCDDEDDPDLPAEDCGSQQIDLTPVGVNIMVAVDGAASMATHWTRIQEAVRQLRQAHPLSAVGLQVFWGELVEDLESGLAKSNWCGATKNNVLEVGDNSAAALVDFLGAAPPGPSYVGGLWETAPVIEPLNYYLTNATKLADPERTNYLIFITNGNDNCFGSVYANKADKLLAFEKLAVELGKLNIRTIPIGFDAAAVPDANGGWGMTVGHTDIDVLTTLLEHGNSGLTELPKVDDPTKLGEVLLQVGQLARNCRFEIPAALDPNSGLNPFQLDFLVNGVVVPRDRRGREGWNFVAGNTTQVELFGQACQAVRADGALEARKTCADDVCGTAAVRVETKPRAVVMVLDSSASRIECTDGTTGCLIPPNLPPELQGLRTSLTYWETVQHALGQTLIAPINDDIEFGLQFFPSKQAANFSCDVASAPEVLSEQGTEITILSQMLEKLPLGFSPVVQVLENIAATPGRLAEPDVEGAVVLLSDGGDNCAEAEQGQVVSRLGDAAASLLAAGIETYVVRFGSEQGRTPEQEAQLRAIVANGGTATSDPADPNQIPYVDARTDAELNAALTAISDTLATCSFELGGLPDDADKAKANLYLNGEVIPFDAMGSAASGWGWVDPEQTTVQLFGDACQAFKTNRRTSVIVEFGCAPVIIF